MDLRDYIKVIRRRWVSAVAVLLGCVALSALITWQTTPEYASTTRLFIATSASDSDNSELFQGGQYATQRVQSYADIVKKSTSLAAAVADEIGDPGAADNIRNSVAAQVVADTVNLEIVATDPDPVRARDIAQAYATQLVARISSLETPDGQTSSPVKATVDDPALITSSPVAPKPITNLGLGIVIGLVLGLVTGFVREMIDNTVTTADDVAGITDAPILGYINADASAVRSGAGEALKTSTAWAEAFRVLRTNMQFIEVDSDRKVFVVSSSLPSEGKTTTAVNLAMTLALTNQKVVLVECDLRRPLVAKRLGLDGAIGTTSVLIGKVTAQEAMQTVGESGLQILACGPIPPNPAELLQSKAMESLIAELRAEFDIVLLDAPPLLPVTDAAILAAQADGGLVIVRHGKTTKEQLGHALDRLDAVDAKTLGVVFNMVPARRGNATYAYSYTYDYSSAPLAVDTKESRAAAAAAAEAAESDGTGGHKRRLGIGSRN